MKRDSLAASMCAFANFCWTSWKPARGFLNCFLRWRGIRVSHCGQCGVRVSRKGLSTYLSRAYSLVTRIASSSAPIAPKLIPKRALLRGDRVSGD